MRNMIFALLLLIGLPAVVWADATPDQRRAVSDQMMDNLQQEGSLAPAPTQASRIFASLVSQTQRRDITYQLVIEQNDKVNSLSTPDGRVVLYSGLLNRIQADWGAVAFVEAQELAHLEAKDAERKMDMQVGTGILGAVLAWRSDLNTKIGAAVAHQLLNSGYSRDLDVKADARALELMQRAGYDPNGALAALKVAAVAEGRGMRVFPYKPRAMDRYNNAMAWMNDHQVAVRQPTDAYINWLMAAHGAPPPSNENNPPGDYRQPNNPQYYPQNP